MQTRGSYATRICPDGNGDEYWVSLSESDAEEGLGHESANGNRTGDAFDLFAYYEHGGDHGAALAAAADMQAANKTDKAAAGQAASISATPFQWRDPATIPPRPWVLGRLLLAGTVNVLIAPGGAGKSTLLSAMALSLATGRALIGKQVHGGAKRVWLWNLEDDQDELSRSLQAAANFHGLSREDIESHLFVDSGMEGSTLCTAIEDRTGLKLFEPVYEALADELKRRGIVVLFVDPFVSSHAVSENDNGKIDAVAKAWAQVAKQASCCIVLSHHTNKIGSADVTANSSRGASALTNAARSVITLNKMTADDAQRLFVPGDERWRYLRVADDKHNRTPAEKADWLRLESVDLGNGDSVGVMVVWMPPEAGEGITQEQIAEVQRVIVAGSYRKDIRANDWVGAAIGPVLGINIGQATGKARVKCLTEQWLLEGYLREVPGLTPQRKPTTFIEVGGRLSAPET